MGRKKKRVTGEARLRLLLEVARLRYAEDLNKTDIANKIGVSTTQVVRLLRQVHDSRLVQIKFNPPTLDQLGMALEQSYGLKKAIVVPGSENYEFGRKLRAIATAKYFERYVEQHPTAKIALSGGNLMYETISALPMQDRDIEIYPAAIIGRGPDILHVDAYNIVTTLWAKSGAQPAKAHYITVLPGEQREPKLDRRGQAIDESEKAAEHICNQRKSLESHPEVSKLLEDMKKVDIVFTSVGPVFPSMIPEAVRFTRISHHSTIMLLEKMGVSQGWLSRNGSEEGAVGDINYCFVTKEGKTKEEWRFFLTLDINHLSKMVDKGKEVVVSAGPYVENVLRAILKVKACSILITDDTMAEKLLKTASHPSTQNRT